MINVDDKQSNETHWGSLFINKGKAVYFDSFANEYISEEAKSKINQSHTVYLEYKIIILLWLNFVVLLPKNIWLQENLCKIIPTYSIRVTLKRKTR